MAQMTYRDAVRRALIEEMERDERVFIMGEEVGVWGGTFAVTRGMYDMFGEKRVRDTPISELVIAGAAVGAAMNGLRPVAEIMTFNFALLSLDAIINHAAKVRYMFGGQFDCPMVLRTTSGWGQLSATHSQTFENYVAHVPGLKVIMPGTPADAYGLLKAAIRDPDPVIFIEHTHLYRVRGEVPDEEVVLPIGRSEVKREGRDVTIVAYSRMLHEALKAADELAKEGIECEVVDIPTLRPLDLRPVIESFKKTYRAVLATEQWLGYGVDAEIAAQIYEHAFDYLDAPIKRVTAPPVPLPYNKNLELAAMPDKEDIKRAVLEVLR
ncbi:pyruvate dehydrogenase E1 component beta subunit [Ardenticatena maritima]|uniref:Pyruvate dehydrogenase n=1 Tax=Ardenticatena maritima TaxID=872965 RepID=A0A0M8K756_9CHLR|nr:alpha-ketoacid dehydrogenase subunit beta [Ardenticatena maritima]KPL89455.1 pyruvate dehydrogenase [Ardenticatena maritima]GAP62112.1 pyruvate dehydrogenase E1 component beta subunit [Ardenticatena maritima]